MANAVPQSRSSRSSQLERKYAICCYLTKNMTLRPGRPQAEESGRGGAAWVTKFIYHILTSRLGPIHGEKKAGDLVMLEQDSHVFLAIMALM